MNKILKFIRTEFFTLSLCFFCSVFFWFFHILSNNFSVKIKVPVKCVYSKDFHLLKTINNTIKVDIIGFGWKIMYYYFDVNFKPIQFNINQSGVTCFDNSNIKNIVASRMTLIKVNNILDDSLCYNLDDIIIKSIFLKLDTSMVLKPKWSKFDSNIVITPSTINCKGPKSEIKYLPDSILFTIPAVFIEKEFNDYVKVKYRPSKNISSRTDKIKVQFKIIK